MNPPSSPPAEERFHPSSDQELTPQIGRTGQALRPAWIEIDLGQLDRNLALLRAEFPPGLQWLSVVKDNAYGHGMLQVAKHTLAAGATLLGVSTLEEGVQLRQERIEAPILLLGERHPDELPFCLHHHLRVTVGDCRIGRLLNELALQAGVVAPIHLKINTGMNRFGLRWDAVAEAVEVFRQCPALRIEGVLSHFSMSDESDKSYALEQLRRFRDALAVLAARGIRPRFRHHANSGGYLDLPESHFDLVRLGILPLGVHPSAVCRRVPHVQPILTVKARLVAIRTLQPGEAYGYGLRYRAPSTRRIGVLPIGYGDGMPRLRNEGCVLLHGRRAPIIGGVAMDATGVDLTDIPETQLWDEAVLLGRQAPEEISAHDLARWGQTVSYDILAGWRHRLPRLYL